MMITIEQYFGGKKHPPEHESNARKLNTKINRLLEYASQDCCYNYWIDPDTGTQISGAKGGSGDGGYRLPDSKTGAKDSSHKTGEGEDVFDHCRILAQWCVLHHEKLDELDLYMEDPRWTPFWCHFQTRRSKSGKRIYIPSTTAPLADALEGQKPIPFIIK